MKIHFISIGGSVMHQLAIALHKKGYQISGSDDEIFEPSRTVLEQNGLLPEQFGWDPNHISTDLDAVLLGMHARLDNPEIIRAKELGLPIYSFPEFIYEESQQKKRVVVGGSHGKTTTTSMIMTALKHAQFQFDYLVGARLDGFDQSVDITDAPVIVCEGDEYPASAIEKRPKFHFLFPHIAVLTGIAWDHINVFPTIENYLEQFSIFQDKIEPGGTIIYNETDETLRTLVESCKRTDLNRIGYGIPQNRQENNRSFISIDGQEVPLLVFGNHNLLNMHAAWLVCSALGMSSKHFLEAMATFTGASKRLEVLESNSNRVVFRDFAHAPSKVKATMQAVKHQFPNRKVCAVLELHTYSSLSVDFMPHYNGALEDADFACVFYSPHAMEIKRMPALAPEIIQNGFKKPGLEIFTDKSELEVWIRSKMGSSENLLLMSSGVYDGMNVPLLAKDWVENI